MVEVPVIKAFTHEGRDLRVGDIIRVAPIVAAVLYRRGVISVTRGYRAAVVVPEPPAEVTPRRRRAYKRRDLSAEPA
jgi:hypothetical protein